MFEQTKALCEWFLKLGIPGFDLIVYKDGQCILRHMGGYADPEKKIPVQGKEKYHIYSCSKLITVTAAMQLWEKGLFSLDDKLSDYMPEFAEILKNYPQVVDFSGHSHVPINDPRSIHQKHFTALGTGSLSYFELDDEPYSSQLVRDRLIDLLEGKND